MRTTIGVCQTYLELYLQHRDPAMIAPTLERFDFILANARTNDLNFSIKGSQERWSWCDAAVHEPAGMAARLTWPPATSDTWT